MKEQKRRGPRYSFMATAAVEVQSGAKFVTRTSELSLHGCYLDMMNPFPEGTQIKLKITHRNADFEALGKVLYAQPNMGMAVAFDTVDPAHQAVLAKWMRELAGT